MPTPIFISVTDFKNQVYEININHISVITEYQHKFDKGWITVVNYYIIPDCVNCGINSITSPERKESVMNRIKVLSSKENI